MKPIDDRVLYVARTTFVVFVLVAGVSYFLRNGGVKPAVQATPAASQSTPAEAEQSLRMAQIQALWARDNGVTSLATPPPKAYQIPPVAGGRLVWTKRAKGRQSWGYVSEKPTEEIVVGALEHYISTGGWSLEYSENLDLSGKAWMGMVRNDKDGTVVGILSLPEELTSPAGGVDNKTRVSIIRVDREGAEDLARTYFPEGAPK